MNGIIMYSLISWVKSLLIQQFFNKLHSINASIPDYQFMSSRDNQGEERMLDLPNSFQISKFSITSS